MVDDTIATVRTGGPMPDLYRENLDDAELQPRGRKFRERVGHLPIDRIFPQATDDYGYVAYLIHAVLFLWSVCLRRKCLLRGQADLLHERLVIPEQILSDHHAIFPVPDRAHREFERLPGRRNCFAVTNRHGLCEGALHYANDACPFARRDLDRM